MIKFKKKIRELRYESNFYNGTVEKSYKTMFNEDEINKLVYELTLKDDNFKEKKLKEYQSLKSGYKILKWLCIASIIYFILKGLLVFVPIVICIFTFQWMVNEAKKNSFNISEIPNNKEDIENIYKGKYLSNRDKNGIYNSVALDFFENKKLVYEYTYFKVVCIQNEGNEFYYWKQVQEVSLIYLNKIKKVKHLPEGIEIEGIGYFQRYNGKTYYNYPKIFIPRYIENFDEILKKFKN